jgi:hypothetical protein
MLTPGDRASGAVVASGILVAVGSDRDAGMSRWPKLGRGCERAAGGA